MLNLAESTTEEWVERALADLDEVLLDHAHCEKKAASMALNLIFRYPERTELLTPLSEIAREELSHFEIMLGELKSRGVEFRRQKPSPYAGKLMKIVRAREPAKFLDTLLCCAMIEARSCERMQRLHEKIDDAGLAALYGSLLKSEARHHSSYVQMAERYFPQDEVKERLAEVAEHEAAVIREAPRVPRMHN